MTSPCKLKFVLSFQKKKKKGYYLEKIINFANKNKKYIYIYNYVFSNLY